jgi:hypothetical protein
MRYEKLQSGWREALLDSFLDYHVMNASMYLSLNSTRLDAAPQNSHTKITSWQAILYFNGMKREEWVAPIPGRPCLTGLLFDLSAISSPLITLIPI